MLLWPGQILIGHPRQNGQDIATPLAPLPAAAEWVINSSFMVLRILQQDVPAFWAAMRSYARQVVGRDDHDATDWLAARVVGRWQSGAPDTRHGQCGLYAGQSCCKRFSASAERGRCPRS